MLARKQPALWVHHALLAPGFPPLVQEKEEIRRQHGVAILAALAALDPDQHVLAVDIADLKAGDLGDAQPGAIGDRQRRLVLEAGCGLEQPRRLVPTQHDGQFARVGHLDQLARKVMSSIRRWCRGLIGVEGMRTSIEAPRCEAPRCSASLTGHSNMALRLAPYLPSRPTLLPAERVRSSARTRPTRSLAQPDRPLQTDMM